MTDTVDISISSQLFERLQALAVPLVDDTDSVIERLINHWEATGGHVSPQYPTKVEKVEIWQSPRGDALPVGCELRKVFKGEAFSAVVEKYGIRFDDAVYSSLSAAAQAAKAKLGITGAAASTNGRDFWEIQGQSSGRWFKVSEIFPTKTINSEALLTELMKS